MKRVHGVLVRRTLQAVAMALLVLSALLISACADDSGWLGHTTSTTLFPSQRSFQQELSGDGYGHSVVLIEKKGDAAIVVVWVAVERDKPARATNDAIFDHAVALAEKYRAADSTEGRLRVELFDPEAGGSVKDNVFESRDFDLAEATTSESAPDSRTTTTLAFRLDATDAQPTELLEQATTHARAASIPLYHLGTSYGTALLYEVAFPAARRSASLHYLDPRAATLLSIDIVQYDPVALAEIVKPMEGWEFIQTVDQGEFEDVIYRSPVRYLHYVAQRDGFEIDIAGFDVAGPLTVEKLITIASELVRAK